MNENILRALMQMFAIEATLDKGIVELAEDASEQEIQEQYQKRDLALQNARNIVDDYLSLLLSQELKEEYLNLYDNFLNEQIGSIKSAKSKHKKRNSLNSVKTLKICDSINNTLQQRDKIIVVIRLLEFVGSAASDKELDFIDTVADTFNIGANDYSDLKTFVLYDIKDIIDVSQLIVVQENVPDFNAVFIKENNLNGRLMFYRLRSVNLMLAQCENKDGDYLFLNSMPMILDRTYIFNNGAVIKSQKITPIYYSDIAGRIIQAEQKAKIDFRAIDIEFKYPNSDNGIHKFSICEESGNLIGIMGGSGVGKSTLLGLLIGSYPLLNGKITINGYSYDEKTLEGIIGYVPQDDLLVEELTVYQNLYFNAKLCFGDYTEEQLDAVINKVLDELELSDIKYLTVGSVLNKFISGGQRKRLNIALELMREPSILIADEPTSGLSSADSEIVMNLFKDQTIKGKLVIVNIHQPSSVIYKMFDKILVMDRGGYPAYYGNPLDAVVYFKHASNNVSIVESECPVCGNVNPEQVLEVLESKMVDEYGRLTHQRKVSPKRWYKLFQENIQPKIDEKIASLPKEKSPVPISNFKKPSLFNQFLIYCKRNLLSKLTDKQYLAINLLESPLLAAILAYFVKYFSGEPGHPLEYVFANNENIPAYMFMCVICALFIGLTVSAEEIIRDQKILKREKFLNLSRQSYLNSKVVVLFLISAIQTISFVLVGNAILEINGLNLNYWLVLFSTSCLANMIGLNISSAFKQVVNIYILIPFIIVPQLLFSGVLVSFDKIHKNFASAEYVPIVGDVMTSRWAFEALAITQFRDNEYMKHFYDVQSKISRCNYQSAYLVPELENRINLVKKNYKENNQYSKDDLHNLLCIKNTIVRLSTLKGEEFAFSNKFNKKEFNDDIAYKALDFLSLVKKEQDKLQAKYARERDVILENLIKQLGSMDAVNELQKKYHNKKLEDYLLNKNELSKIRDGKDILICMKDPAFQFPYIKTGRAHFYSPVKRIADMYIDTFWFNIAFIWLSALLFYITLTFDVLKKIVNFTENFRRNQRKKIKK